MSERKQCLTPGCTDRSYTRGLCRRCYGRLADQVRRERTTWEQLEASGECAAARRSERDHTCLTAGCDGKAGTRGLCDTCYRRHKKRVYQEQTTWEALEEMGLAEPLVKKVSGEAMPEKRAWEQKNPRKNAVGGDTTYHPWDWTRSYWSRWDAYLQTRIGSVEARIALDAVLGK